MKVTFDKEELKTINNKIKPHKLDMKEIRTLFESDIKDYFFDIFLDNQIEIAKIKENFRRG